MISQVMAGLQVAVESITGIGTVYQIPPENSPEDNSAWCEPTELKIDTTPLGMIDIIATWNAYHVVRRTRFQNDVTRLFPFIDLWISTLSARANVTLGGSTYFCQPTNIKIRPLTINNQDYVAIVTTIETRSEMVLP